MCILMFERDSWTDHLTSSDMGAGMYRDVLGLCWSIMAAIHTRTTHDEFNTRCCRKHVA